MDLLISAGVQSLQNVKDAHRDHQKNIHSLRQALVEAFMGICNGVSQTLDTESPPYRGDEAIPSEVETFVFQHMENMFYYIEKLVALEDLSITTVLGKEILDLYSDIVLNCFHYLF